LRPRALLALVVALVVAATLVGATAADAAPQKAKSKSVTVMTRNLFLGADLGPAIAAPNLNALFDATGGIYNEVGDTNFPARAKPLAKEILKRKPDLVGLQEVALWRDRTPATLDVFPPKATDVRYDFLKLLLAQVNKNGKQYKAVKVQPEFDFEAPVNLDQDGTGLPGSELNSRLTMRDVILARVGHGVKTSAPEGSPFDNLLHVTVGGGIDVPVTRGWTSIEANVRGAKFRFVNTHLEAFDPGARLDQAMELVDSGGPASSSKPVVMLGDFNSDDDLSGDPNAIPEDELPYEYIVGHGYTERSKAPLTCCIQGGLDDPSSGDDFNHQVDHVFTNKPSKIKLTRTFTVGTDPFRQSPGPVWPSDHAGVVSVLKFK
jgi:endonuclease/exonuclease/phosphatase family metal-dependent hydrolase